MNRHLACSTKKSSFVERASCPFLRRVQNVSLTGITSTGVFDFLRHIRTSQFESGWVLLLNEEYHESSDNILSNISKYILCIYLFLK
ncbi:hypothetical protein QUB75_21470 [Microcoleus sp. K1-B6]|uniref:hypothetical protein n=1 Tax=unclassified Microcoleus TaxID=2642155 RepID=UPI002FD21CC4